MQITLALAALATVASAAIGSSPTAPAPAGCTASYDGPFQITIVNISAPATKAKRQSTSCGQAGLLTVTLADGVLKDSQNRQGEIVANYQFQFDNPLQAGAVYTQGFSVCGNGSLALGGTNVFYECETFGGPGIGNYSNLYSQSTGAQCNPILIDIIPCAGTSTSTTAVVGQSGDGQVTATGTPGSPVSQISDGQVQGTTVAPKPTCVVSQISDGQVQVTVCPTPTPACVVSQISDGQLQYTSCPSGAPVSQISDGQIQATTAKTTVAPVSQISDGQIQATTASTAAPVSQISDGQIQATTKAPVSQISDGQIQATTMVTQPSSSLAVVSQISDGQIQATGTSASNLTATSTPVQVSANAANGLAGSSVAALMVGIAALLL